MGGYASKEPEPPPPEPEKEKEKAGFARVKAFVIGSAATGPKTIQFPTSLKKRSFHRPPSGETYEILKT